MEIEATDVEKGRKGLGQDVIDRLRTGLGLPVGSEGGEWF